MLAVVLDPLVFGGHMQSHDDLGDEQLHALGTLVMGLHVSMGNLISDHQICINTLHMASDDHTCKYWSAVNSS